MSTPADLIIDARWIATVDPTNQLLEHHSLVVRNGRIDTIMPTAGVTCEARERISRPHHLLMPGLINAHGHAAMALFRGLADDLPLMTWLNEHIWPAEGTWVDERFVETGTQLALAEMIRGGTTCFSDMYFFPTITARVAHEAQLRAAIHFPILDFPSAWAKDADDYLHKGLQLHDDYRNHDLIKVGFGPHAPYTVSDAPLQRIATLAVETNMMIQIHLHETAHEVDEAFRTSGQRPLRRLQGLGLLGPQLQAVHMTQLNEDDIRLVAEHGVHVIHCPESNLKLASGFCPVASLLAAGVNVALGTDGAASNNDLDMLSEMRTAALLAKGVAGDPAAVPAEQAVRMATINGARALGIDEQTGSLEVGKSADMIAINLQQVATQPCYSPLSQLVYAAHSSQVSDSWVTGRRLLRDGVLTTLNEQHLIQQAEQWQQRIAEFDRQNTGA